MSGNPFPERTVSERSLAPSRAAPPKYAAERPDRAGGHTSTSLLSKHTREVFETEAGIVRKPSNLPA